MSSVVVLKKGPVVEAEKNIPSQLRVSFSGEATRLIFRFISDWYDIAPILGLKEI